MPPLPYEIAQLVPGPGHDWGEHPNTGVVARVGIRTAEINRYRAKDFMLLPPDRKDGNDAEIFGCPEKSS
jgi:hypothetical protein